MTALEYQISLGYGATSAPYSAARPHRGIDYAAPGLTPIVVQGVLIGVAGHTGNTAGPHVHVQVGRDEWAQVTIDPAPYVGQAGTVVKVGTASEWGNYVCVRVDDANVFYCHMNRTVAVVGQTINRGVKRMTPSEIDELISWSYNQVAGKAPSDAEFNFHREQFAQQGDKWAIQLISGFKDDNVAWKRYKRLLDAAQPTVADVTINGTKYVPSK